MNVYEEKTNQISNKLMEVNQDKLHVWKEYVLFDWHWWFGLFVAIIAVTCFLLFRRKNSTDRLVYVGFPIALISVVGDTIGVFYGLWEYHYELLPATSNYFPWDFFVLPVTIIFALQIKPKMNPFLKGVVYAIIASFIGLPLLKWIGIYNPLNWNYFYSFVILFFMFLFADWLSKRTNFDNL